MLELVVNQNIEDALNIASNFMNRDWPNIIRAILFVDNGSVVNTVNLETVILADFHYHGKRQLHIGYFTKCVFSDNRMAPLPQEV